MRYVLLALGFWFVTLNAAACPNLDGVFGCTNLDGSVEVVTIHQIANTTPIVYQYNDTNLVADNQIYPVPADRDLRGGLTRSWCDGDLLRTDLVGQYFHDEVYRGDLHLKTILTRQEDNLSNIAIGELASMGDKYPLQSVRVCIKMSDASPRARESAE